MLNSPSPIPAHRPYPMPPPGSVDLKSLGPDIIDALLARDGASLIALFEAQAIPEALGERAPDYRGRLLGEAILAGPGPSPELLAPWILHPFEGLFQGTLAALGAQERTKDARSLLDWMNTLSGPFEALIPQGALLGALGLCAFADASASPLPEGLWEGSVSRLVKGMSWDPRRPGELKALAVLGQDSGPCGRWIQGALRGELLRELEAGGEANPRAVALMGALLPGAGPYGPESLEGLRIQLPSTAAWRRLLMQGQCVCRAPLSWLPELLDVESQNLSPEWRSIWLISQVSAAPGTAPIEALEAALNRGEGEVVLSCASFIEGGIPALRPTCEEILSSEDHPMGAVALTLMRQLGESIEDVKNTWGRIALGDDGALEGALTALAEGLSLERGSAGHQGPAALVMAMEIGHGCAQSPGMGRRLMEDVTKGGETRASLLALDGLAQALWTLGTAPQGLKDEARALRGDLHALAKVQIEASGELAITWGRILGWTGPGDSTSLEGLLGLIARTPQAHRHRLMAPLGCLGSHSQDCLKILLGPIRGEASPTLSHALNGLINLSLSPGSPPLQGPLWEDITGCLNSLKGGQSAEMEPFLSKALWVLSRR